MPVSPTVPLLEFLISGKTVDFSANISLLKVVQSVYGTMSFRLRGHTTDVEFWETVLHDAGTLNVKMRWGHGTSEGQFFSEWLRVLLTKFRLNYESPGVLLDISGLGFGAILNFRVGDHAYIGQRVSDIVTTIAERHSLASKIHTTEGTNDYWQADRSEIEFIKNCLLPRAAGTDGRKDYLFFFDGDTLVFSPPNLQQTPVRYYASLGASDVSSTRSQPLDMEYNLLNALGALPREVRGFDPLTKEVIALQPTEGPPPLARYEASLPTDLSAVEGIAAPTSSFLMHRVVADFADAQRSQAMRHLFQARLQVIPDPTAPLAGIADVIAHGGKGNYLGSGRYLITGVTHELRPSAYKTILTLERWSHN